MQPNQVQIHGKTFELFLSYESILRRIEDLCRVITDKYSDKQPIFIGILNGAFMFSAEVMKHVKFDAEISFVKLKSYEGDQSTGKVVSMLGLEVDLKGRHVILLEDIVDTGNTLHHFIPSLDAYEPASVSLYTLLVKPDALQFPLHIDYAGFSVPNHFLIGFGLDYDGLGRNYPDIYRAVD